MLGYSWRLLRFNDSCFYRRGKVGIMHAELRIHKIEPGNQRYSWQIKNVKGEVVLDSKNTYKDPCEAWEEFKEHLAIMKEANSRL